MRSGFLICLCAAAVACGGSTGGGPPDSGTPDSGLAGAAKPMPLLSDNAPAYGANGGPASGATSSSIGENYESSSIPMSVAVDLSGVPADQRQHVLVAWYAKTQDYIIDTTNVAGEAFTEIPIDYTLETNTAAGGALPATGWTPALDLGGAAVVVTGNDRSSRQALVDLKGANWVRMSVTRGIDPNKVGLKLKIHAAPSGATDDWLFMGDSNTQFTMPVYVNTIPALVHGLNAAHTPAVIDAAIGGHSTASDVDTVAETVRFFPGQYVVLAYGTNDSAASFQMDAMIQHVLDAGKTPVVPHMPWGPTPDILTKGPLINAQIDALYVKYGSQVIKGPDLWAIFTGRTDILPDIHFTAEGQEELRKAWAQFMVTLY